MIKRNPFIITVHNNKGDILFHVYKCTYDRAWATYKYLSCEKKYPLVGIKRKYCTVIFETIAKNIYDRIQIPYLKQSNHKEYITDVCKMYDVDEDDVYETLSKKYGINLR